MKNLRRGALLLLTLVMSLLLAVTPAFAEQWDIVSLGEAMREAQSAYDAADAAYDELCETVFTLQERYDNGTEAEQLAVQDALLEAMIGEEEAYAALDEATTALEELYAVWGELMENADCTTHELTARGYDSTLTIAAALDADNYIWAVSVEVNGDERDQAVSQPSFLTQFIGRQLPLSTDKKDAEAIVLLSDARVTSQAVVDALNSLAASADAAAIPENPGRPLTEPQEIADYIFLYGKLPPNFITKRQAQDLGWDSSYNYVGDVAPGKSIGGDRFGNYEGLLPAKKGRQWYEADCYYNGGRRNAYRILFSNDGLVYYTDDHYESFTQMFPSWE